MVLIYKHRYQAKLWLAPATTDGWQVWVIERTRGIRFTEEDACVFLLTLEVSGYWVYGTE